DIADGHGVVTILNDDLPPLTTAPQAEEVFGQNLDFGARACNLGIGGPGPATFCSPVGLTLDAAGDLFVADRDNNRVVRWTDVLERLPTSGADSIIICANGCHPIGVAVDGQGTPLVAETAPGSDMAWLPDPIDP